MAMKPLYRVLAGKVGWDPPVGTQYVMQRAEEIERLMALMPSGSGWDCGTKVSEDSKPDRLVFYGEFHHMDEQGSYDGWTDHSIIVTPSLAHGFKMRITGKDRNEIKDYLHEMFDFALWQEVEEWPVVEKKEA